MICDGSRIDALQASSIPSQHLGLKPSDMSKLIKSSSHGKGHTCLAFAKDGLYVTHPNRLDMVLIWGFATDEHSLAGKIAL